MNIGKIAAFIMTSFCGKHVVLRLVVAVRDCPAARLLVRFDCSKMISQKGVKVYATRRRSAMNTWTREAALDIIIIMV